MKTTYWDVLIDVGFWTVLAKKKLDIFKLTSEDQPLFAKYRLAHMPDRMASLSIDAFSYEYQTVSEKIGPVEVQISGEFLNTNTVEEFKSVNPDE